MQVYKWVPVAYKHNITFIQEATTQIQKLSEKGNREVNPVYEQFP